MMPTGMALIVATLNTVTDDIKTVIWIVVMLQCRTLALLEEAEPNAFVQLKAAATMLQKHWRGIQVSIF